MAFERYIVMFNEYLVVNRYSPRTVEVYNTDVSQFLKFIKKYYPRINLIEKVTTDIIFDYQNFLLNCKNRYGKILANKTQRCKLHAIKTFFNTLMKKDLILKNPTSVMRLPKDEYRVTRNILTQQEIFDILKSIKLDSPNNIRNKAIIELFYSCGIRTTELCNLMTDDVNLNEQTVIIINGKGGKTRLVPIGQYAAHYIQLYLEKARIHMLRGKPDPGNLFLSRTGHPFNKSTINTGVMRSILRNVKIDKHVSCYTFRHCCATHLLANKVDITYIAKLLGHKSLRTTQHYTHVEISDLKKMHTLHHPRERNNH